VAHLNNKRRRFVRQGAIDMALYDDIGGAPAVRAALDAFYPRVLADPTLSHFFAAVADEAERRECRGVRSIPPVFEGVLVDLGVPDGKVGELASGLY
jgi:hypothetical protein